MDDRRRIVREIRRNAALVFGCDVASVTIAFDRVEDSHETWRAVARGAKGERLGADGEDANAALVALLGRVIDRANGEPIDAPILSPELRQEMFALKRARQQRIAELRAELDGAPENRDDDG